MAGFHRGPMGFQIDFPNGWTVSVQFGIGNYCSNRDGAGNPFRDTPDFLESKTAEIAAWRTDSRGANKGTSTKDWYTFERNGDQVAGWQTPDNVLEFMNMIAKLEGEGGEYLSECCDAVEIGELSDNDGDLYRTGFCGTCKDNAIFTYEVSVMSYIDKQEYEERHGDHVGYCRVHHITVLDSCPYCDDDRLQECAQCHYSIYDAPDDFSWAEIDGEMQLLCWGCTDKLHKGSMVIDSPSDIPAHNVDYIH